MSAEHGPAEFEGPLRKPLALARRHMIGEALAGGISIEALMNTGQATEEELEAFYSDPNAQDDVDSLNESTPGEDYAA